MLAVLTSVSGPEELRIHPQWRPHPLKGDRKGFWAMDVSAGQRLVFRFRDGRAWDISMLDYH